MNPDEFGDAEIVRHQNSVKAPLVAKNVNQELFIAVGRNAVNFVVGSHDTLHMAFFDGGFEWLQPIFTNDSFRVIAGRNVGAAFGLAMDSEMFRRRQHTGFVDERPGTLKSMDGRNADARNEIRILTVGFFRAAPAWIARKIQNRRQTFLRASSANLSRSRRKYIVHQVRIPSGRQPDRRGVGSAFWRGMPVQAFFVEKNRNAKTSIFSNPLLHRVRELRHIARIAAFAWT